MYILFVCLCTYSVPGIYPDITSIPAGLRSRGSCRPVNRLKAPPTIIYMGNNIENIIYLLYYISIICIPCEKPARQIRVDNIPKFTSDCIISCIRLTDCSIPSQFSAARSTDRPIKRCICSKQVFKSSTHVYSK